MEEEGKKRFWLGHLDAFLVGIFPRTSRNVNDLLEKRELNLPREVMN